MRAEVTHEEAMPKAYWVVTYRWIKNPAAWEAYAKIAVPAIKQAGGRFLALGLPKKIWEAGLEQRVVLVEFDSLEAAIACHDTPEYKEALRLLGTGNVERDMRVVEGTP
jgi:uncharacterized protein (DUF1330 family)